jgi:hypothetical protein
MNSPPSDRVRSNWARVAFHRRSYLPDTQPPGLSSCAPPARMYWNFTSVKNWSGGPDAFSVMP